MRRQRAEESRSRRLRERMIDAPAPSIYTFGMGELAVWVGREPSLQTLATGLYCATAATLHNRQAAFAELSAQSVDSHSNGARALPAELRISRPCAIRA